MGKIEKSELLEYFLAEAEDYLNVLSFGIPQLENAVDRNAILEELFRSAHTLKGAAAIVKLAVTSQLAHRMEDVLDALRSDRMVVTRDTIDLLLSMLDSVAIVLKDISEGREEDPAAADKFEPQIEALMASVTEPEGGLEAYGVHEARHDEASGYPDAASVAVPVYDYEAPVSPATDSANAEALTAEKAFTEKTAEPKKDDVEYFFGNFIRIDLRKIEDMFNLIGEVTIMKNHMLKKTKDAGDLSEEVLHAGKRLLEEINRFADRHAFSFSDNARYVDPVFSEFGELEFDRYDEQNIFSRKVQELTEDITEALKELMNFYETFQDDIKSLDRTVKFLRSDLSESRMLDIGRLFQRFVRPVKDLAKEHGKKIDFQITGQGTKIDRVIFENLFDPLMHLIRNAVSHGIETGDERASKGKKREGTLTLLARREGINIIIEIKDDGAGINTARVFDEAVRRGLVKPDASLSREEILSLIFVQGFSTAGVTDMTSGRGVGMNAVRNQISSINGTLELNTELDKGTTFRIKVPSSLAITNVIVFGYGNMEFVMPTSVIEEVVQFDPVVVPGEEEAAASPESSEMIVNYRGTHITARRLSEMFNAGANAKMERKDTFVIVCSVSNKKMGLVVDEVFSQEEAIIKPVNKFLEGLNVYSGMTISGDGKVRLVLNPIKIFEGDANLLLIGPSEAEAETGRNILIVDDSLSVRKYLTIYFESKNLRVSAAANGSEALKYLEEHDDVDLIVADLEMPIMHGYELVSRIKSIDRLKHIPIIVLTSRGTAKHKEKALELGADEYMVKPFDERIMEETLRKYTLLPSY